MQHNRYDKGRRCLFLDSKLGASIVPCVEYVDSRRADDGVDVVLTNKFTNYKKPDWMERFEESIEQFEEEMEYQDECNKWDEWYRMSMRNPNDDDNDDNDDDYGPAFWNKVDDTIDLIMEKCEDRAEENHWKKQQQQEQEEDDVPDLIEQYETRKQEKEEKRQKDVYWAKRKKTHRKTWYEAVLQHIVQDLEHRLEQKEAELATRSSPDGVSYSNARYDDLKREYEKLEAKCNKQETDLRNCRRECRELKNCQKKYDALRDQLQTYKRKLKRLHQKFLMSKHCDACQSIQ